MSLHRNINLLLKRRGRVCQLEKKVYGEYDPETSEIGVTTTHNNSWWRWYNEYQNLGLGDPDTVDVRCYFSNFTVDEVKSRDIPKSHSKVFIGALDINGIEIPNPETEDLIFDSGYPRTIISVSEIYSYTSKIAYICEVTGNAST